MKSYDVKKQILINLEHKLLKVFSNYRISVELDYMFHKESIIVSIFEREPHHIDTIDVFKEEFRNNESFYPITAKFTYQSEGRIKHHCVVFKVYSKFIHLGILDSMLDEMKRTYQESINTFFN